MTDDLKDSLNMENEAVERLLKLAEKFIELYGRNLEILESFHKPKSECEICTPKKQESKEPLNVI